MILKINSTRGHTGSLLVVTTAASVWEEDWYGVGDRERHVNTVVLLLQLPLSERKIDMASVIEREAKRMVLYEIPGITRCLLSESHELGQEGVMKLRFEGVNVQVGVQCNPNAHTHAPTRTLVPLNFETSNLYFVGLAMFSRTFYIRYCNQRLNNNLDGSDQGSPWFIESLRPHMLLCV